MTGGTCRRAGGIRRVVGQAQGEDAIDVGRQLAAHGPAGHGIGATVEFVETGAGTVSPDGSKLMAWLGR
jgi:hypothetical protein